jgi:hypothetical protein
VDGHKGKVSEVAKLGFDVLFEVAILARAVAIFRAGRSDGGLAVLAVAVMTFLQSISEDSKTVGHPVYGDAYIGATVVRGLGAALLFAAAIICYRTMQRRHGSGLLRFRRGRNVSGNSR